MAGVAVDERERVNEGQTDDQVRTAGLVDAARLGEWLDAQGLPGVGAPVEVCYITGGASNELFEIRRGDARWALRRPPHPAPPGRSETMLREYRIIAALASTDVPHARAVAACDDQSVVGDTFYLMDFVDGWSPISEPTWPEPFLSDLTARRGLATELVDAIAVLSNVDWQARGLTDLGRPEGFHDRQVDRWYAHLERFKFRELPGLDDAAAWLREYRPSVYEPGIMHGDYQFANVMFHHGAPARLAAIVDWEMGTVGDPLLDLAWVVMGWPNADEDRNSSYVDLTGMPNRDELLARYHEVSGRPVDEIDYYVILGRFKMAVVLEGGYARYLSGGADNPKMETFGAVVLDMAAKAAELAESTSLRPMRR